MLTTTLRQSLAALASAVVYVASSSALAHAEPELWLSVDMPHGGCSLNVGQDGRASINFGAMPRFVHVAPGTFDFEQLVRDLREKSYPQSTGRRTGVPVGSVSLPASRDLLLIDDEKLVNSFLQRAWKARVLPSTAHEIEDYNWVSKACALR